MLKLIIAFSLLASPVLAETIQTSICSAAGAGSSQYYPGPNDC
jgi:hypothetical protein